MDEIIKLAGEAYLLSILVHAKTIGEDALVHLYTQGIYEGLFDILHDIAEKKYATDNGTIDDEALVADLYAKTEALKTSLKFAIPVEKDEGIKNQLIQKYDDAQQLCAKVKSLQCDDDPAMPKITGLKPKGY